MHELPKLLGAKIFKVIGRIKSAKMKHYKVTHIMHSILHQIQAALLEQKQAILVQDQLELQRAVSYIYNCMYMYMCSEQI